MTLRRVIHEWQLASSSSSCKSVITITIIISGHDRDLEKSDTGVAAGGVEAWCRLVKEHHWRVVHLNIKYQIYMVSKYIKYIVKEHHRRVIHLNIQTKIRRIIKTSTMVTITMDQPHKKILKFQGSENAATFTLALLFPALILPSLKTTTNQSSLKLELF